MRVKKCAVFIDYRTARSAPTCVCIAVIIAVDRDIFAGQELVQCCIDVVNPAKRAHDSVFGGRVSLLCGSLLHPLLLGAGHNRPL